MRERCGDDIHLLHDVHHRLTPIEAARLGKAVEEHALFWLEDPVPAERQEGYRLIRQHTTTPLAVGEVFNSIWDCETLISEQLIDYIRTAVTHAGGITHVRRIFALAELYDVKTGSHGATDLSPVCLLRRCTSTWRCPTSASRSTCRTPSRPTRSSRTAIASRTVTCTPARARASASTLDEELAATLPYRRAYLPVARRRDGSMHSW